MATDHADAPYVLERRRRRGTRLRRLKASSAVVVLASGLMPLSTGAISAQEAPTEIVVTNNSDALNGDTSSVANLVASPGDDGISLREAIQATNNDPGSYTIRFDAALAGASITIGPFFPSLTGGNVTISGDVDDNGTPDVEVRGDPDQVAFQIGFHIASGGNHLHALTLAGFFHGVLLRPGGPEGNLPTFTTFADNAITGMVMQDIVGAGIWADSVVCPSSDGSGSIPPPCDSFNTWANSTITNNAIESDTTGIKLVTNANGDDINVATITDNTIRIVGEDTDAGISLETAGGTDGRISDVVVARNSIEGNAAIGIHIVAGSVRGQGGTAERVRVLNNQVHLVSDGQPEFCCQGIVINAGSDAPSFAVGPPVRYLDDNVVRDVVVRGNSITGTLQWGMQVIAGHGGGGRRNRVMNLRIRDNVVRTSLPGVGVWVTTGGGTPYQERDATENRISDLRIAENSFRIGTGPAFRDAAGGAGAAGIVLLGGGSYSRENLVREVLVARNTMRTAYVGIRVIGGLGETARRNRVICVPQLENHIIGARKNISVRSNVDGAGGNIAKLGGC